jgi:hypothetical protein
MGTLKHRAMVVAQAAGVGVPHIIIKCGIHLGKLTVPFVPQYRFIADLIGLTYYTTGNYK